MAGFCNNSNEKVCFGKTAKILNIFASPVCSVNLEILKEQ
jgi:hypothetical protein